MTSTATMRAGQFGRPTLSKDGRTMTVHIPITLRHQGGRKQVVTPAGATPWIQTPSRVDNTIVKAIVRAHLRAQNAATRQSPASRRSRKAPLYWEIFRLFIDGEIGWPV